MSVGMSTVVERLLAILGVSTDVALLIAAVTLLLTIAILVGPTTRLVVWIEDLSYRCAQERRSNGSHPLG
jgi:hypothetical protein